MLLFRAIIDFWPFIAIIAGVTGGSVVLTYKFPEKKFQIRKWLHILAVGLTAFAVQLLSTIIPDLISEQQTFRALVLFDEFLILILNFTCILWLAVFCGFFKINGRKSWGIAWFPFALFVILYFIRFMFNIEKLGTGLYFTAIAFYILAFADGFAALFGYKVNPNRKTPLGSSIFLLISFLILIASFKFLSPVVSAFPFWGNPQFIVLFSFFGALMLTALEYQSKNGIDNLNVPVAAAIYLFSFSASPFWLTIVQFHSIYFWGVFFSVISLIVLVYRAKWLTESGIVMALILAYVLFLAQLSILPVLIFFILGTLSGKLPVKNYSKSILSVRISADNKHGKPRDATQVLANGGVPLLIGFLLILNQHSYLSPNIQDLFQGAVPSNFWNRLNWAYWAVMSAALSDTFSSELGMRFGKSPFDIMGFRKLQAGASGGVTWAGVLFGLLGSVIMACFFIFIFSGDVNSERLFKVFSIIILAGVFGTLFDSVLGSLFQRKVKNSIGIFVDDPSENYSLQFWSNDAVNLVSLIVVGIIAFIIT